MKRIAISVSSILCITSLVYGGDPRLRIDPAQPHPGGALTVTYDPKTGPLENSDTPTLVYGFKRWENKRARLQSKDGHLTAKIALPLDAVYFWCWVEGKTPDDRDTNRGGAWDTYLYDTAGMPLEGARAARAALYSLREQPPDTNTVALILAEEELRDFPANAMARAQWWTLRFEDAGKTNAARQEILHEIGVFFDSNLDRPWAYQAAALGYNHMNRNPQSLEVLRAFVKRFPEDPLCDSVLLTLMMNFGTESDLESLPRASSRWASDEGYWDALMFTYERTHASPEKLLSVGRRRLALLPPGKDELAQTRYRIAETWLSNGVDPVEAEKVAREAVAISEIGPRLEMPANAVASPKLNSHFILAIHRSTLGWALFQEGRYQEAMAELQRAAAIQDKEKRPARAVYYRVGQTLEKLGRPADAMDAYVKELAKGDLEKPTRAAIAELYRSSHSNLNGLDDYVNTRVNDLLLSSTDAAAQPIDEMNAKPGRFDLRGPDGRPVQLSGFQGKLVLIDFWATWCGPCLKSLENTQKLVKKYPGQIVVLAVAIDAEENHPRAAQYLKDRAYPFILLFDDENRRDLPVAGVPTRYLIDAHGMVRVHETGWLPEEEVIFEKKLTALLPAAR